MDKFNNMNNQVKKPCVGCVYFDACGNTNRTQPCNGRVTKSNAKKTEDINRAKKNTQGQLENIDDINRNCIYKVKYKKRGIKQCLIYIIFIYHIKII